MFIKKLWHHWFHKKYEQWEFLTIQNCRDSPNNFWTTTHDITCTACSHKYFGGYSIPKASGIAGTCGMGYTHEEALEKAKNYNQYN